GKVLFLFSCGGGGAAAKSAMSSYLFAQFRVRVPGASAAFIRTADGRVLTYGGMLALSARLAHALVSLGVEPGDRVAVPVAKSPEAIALYLACLRAGAVSLPLNTAYTKAEIAYFVGDAEPALFVAAPGKEDAPRGVPVVTLGIDGKSGTL